MPSCLRCVKYYKDPSACDFVDPNAKKAKRSLDAVKVSSGPLVRDPSQNDRQESGLVTALTTSRPDPFDSIAIPRNDFQAYELLRFMFKSTIDPNDIRRSITLHVNRCIYMEYSSQSKGGLSALLAHVDSDDTPDKGRASPQIDFQHRHVARAIRELRRVLSLGTTVVLDPATSLMVCHLFWVANAMNDAVAAEAHLEAIVTLVISNPNQGFRRFPFSVPGRLRRRRSEHGEQLNWTFDREGGTVSVPKFMIPRTGPLSPCGIPEVIPAGFGRLHSAKAISSAIAKHTACVRYLLELQRLDSYHVSRDLTRDMVRYKMILSWAWAAFDNLSSFEEAVFTILTQAFFSLYNSCHYTSIMEQWLCSTSESIDAAMKAVPPDQVGRALQDPAQAPFLIWVSLLLGRHTRDDDTKKWCSNLLRTSLDTHAAVTQGLCDFYTISSILERDFLWDTTLIGPEAKLFWDQVLEA